jgi:predicted nucleotide-binding protein
LFIGCSSEALDVGRELQSALAHDAIVARLWTDDVFRASHHPAEDLVALAERQDFAVLVATPDDVTQTRGADRRSPRDNIVFELGLFMGAVGRERTVVVQPRGVELKLPSDFLGLTTIPYAEGDARNMAARLGPVANAIRKLVDELGPR